MSDAVGLAWKTQTLLKEFSMHTIVLATQKGGSVFVHVLHWPEGMSAENWKKQLQMFAAEVMPAFQPVAAGAGV